jgi:hypothetical protein
LQHIAGSHAFPPIFLVHQLAIPSAQRDALHLEALPLQRMDFAANETVADLGVMVDEIRDARRRQRQPLRAVRFVFDQLRLSPPMPVIQKFRLAEHFREFAQHQEYGVPPVFARRASAAKCKTDDLQRINQQ